MNKAAVIKGEIYDKLAGFSEQELAAVVSFIDDMKYGKATEKKKIIKLDPDVEKRIYGYRFDAEMTLEKTPFSHPYYWGAFTCNGNWM